MFQPLHNLMTIVADEKKPTAGGLVMPDNFTDVFLTGIVRAVGHGVLANREEVGTVDVGDRVMVIQHRQQGPGGSRVMPYPKINDDGIECILCNVQEVIGVITSNHVDNS